MNIRPNCVMVYNGLINKISLNHVVLLLYYFLSVSGLLKKRQFVIKYSFVT